MVCHASDSGSTDYVNDSLCYGIFSFFASAIPAGVWRLAERHYFNPDLNPFWFGAACTIGADAIRYMGGQRKLRDNPAIFMGSAVAYTAVSYLMR